MSKSLSVVCNSSPIIGLSLISHLDLLWKIFDIVYITEAVYEEVVINAQNKIGGSQLKSAVNNGEIKIYKVKDELFVSRFSGRLHKGELEVIIAAKELKTDYLLLDKRDARVLATTLLLEPTGIIGVLRIAKIKGEIESLRELLDELIDKGFRISRSLYMEVIDEVGEL